MRTLPTRWAALLFATALVFAGPALAGNAANYNYALHCLGCHTGKGVSPPLGHIPPLKDQVGHFARLPDGRKYLVHVPGVVNANLPAGELAALLNWMIATYAGASADTGFVPFTEAEVVALRRERVDDAMRLRAQVRSQLAAQGHAVGQYP